MRIDKDCEINGWMKPLEKNPTYLAIQIPKQMVKMSLDLETLASSSLALTTIL